MDIVCLGSKKYLTENFFPLVLEFDFVTSVCYIKHKMLVIIVSLQCELSNQSFCSNFFAVLQACEMHYFYYVAFGFSDFFEGNSSQTAFPHLFPHSFQII